MINSLYHFLAEKRQYRKLIIALQKQNKYNKGDVSIYENRKNRGLIDSKRKGFNIEMLRSINRREKNISRLFNS